MSRDGLRSPLAPERVAGRGMVEVGGTAFVGAGVGRIWLGGCVRGGVCPSGLARLECILGKSVRNPSARTLARCESWRSVSTLNAQCRPQSCPSSNWRPWAERTEQREPKLLLHTKLDVVLLVVVRRDSTTNC